MINYVHAFLALMGLHVFYVINMLHNNYLITRIHNIIYSTYIMQPTNELKQEQ